MQCTSQYLPEVIESMVRRLNIETIGILKSSVKRILVKRIMEMGDGSEELVNFVRGF